MDRGEIYLNENIRTNADSNRSSGNTRRNIALYVIAGVSVLIVIIAIIAGFSTYSQSYVATIGKMKVTIPEFQFALTQEKANMLDIAGNPDPDTFWDTTITGGEKAIDIAKRKSLENVRALKIQLDKAKSQGIKLDDADIKFAEQITASILAQYNNNKAEANAATLQIYGVSLKEFENIYKQLILRNKFIQYELERIEADESEIETYYNKFPDAFKDTSMRYNGEEAVWIKHILISTVDENQRELEGEKLEAAKKKAEELLQRAKSGEDFARLAIENSEDPGSAAKGGDYLFGRGHMESAFEEAAFALEPGEISDLVKTSYGYHIIKMEEKIAQDEPVSLRCAKDYYEFQENAVKMAKFLEKMEEWKKDPKYQIIENRKVYDKIQ
jgi:foldase protein PrsA